MFNKLKKSIKPTTLLYIAFFICMAVSIVIFKSVHYQNLMILAYDYMMTDMVMAGAVNVTKVASVIFLPVIFTLVPMIIGLAIFSCFVWGWVLVEKYKTKESN